MKNKLYSRRDFVRVTSGSLAAGIAGFPYIASAAPKTKSTIVLGIDGMDPGLLQQYINKGMMPNAKKLMEMGSFSPLKTSDPPQSPVAWSNFISGTNPGGHGIFDFIARDPKTMTPYLSTSNIVGETKNVKIGKWLIPTKQSEMVNLRGGATFWKDLEDHGIDSTILRMPSNFPPAESKRAKTLSGLGTPDIHGSYGVFSYFTDESDYKTELVSGGQIKRVEVKDNIVSTSLRGPINSFDPKGKEANIPFKVFIDPTNPTALVSIQNNEFILHEGEWSDWIRVSFELLPHLVDVSCICRFHLKSIRDNFALYVSPINIDPKKPTLPISTPESYSRELADRMGDYYTQGMPPDTSALQAGVFDDNLYKQQAIQVLEEEVKMFETEFARFQEGFFFAYFASLDLNSHMFWRAIDPAHPLYTKELAEKQGYFLPWLYQQMDKVIGTALERMNDNTTLFVVSDHGFGSFRRQFNLNTWLMEKGFCSSQVSKQSMFADVSWSKTSAYGFGINGLYLNIKGREPNGIIPKGMKARSLKRKIKAQLLAETDPATGEKILSNVYDPEEIYSGPYVKKAPDLILGYNRNYRASWDTILGGFSKDFLEDNTDSWSGDHVIDSKFMSGVILSNRKIQKGDPALLDMAPTILSEHGVPVPKTMTGKNIL